MHTDVILTFLFNTTCDTKIKKPWNMEIYLCKKLCIQVIIFKRFYLKNKVKYTLYILYKILIKLYVYNSRKHLPVRN